MIGEVDGRKMINIGDIVDVKLADGGEACGRLNEVSKEEIKVGIVFIEIENIIDIKKQNG